MIMNKHYFPLTLILCFLFGCSDEPLVQEVVTTPNAVTSEQYLWDLTDLYPDLSAWQVAKEKAAQQIKDLTKLQGTLGNSSATL